MEASVMVLLRSSDRPADVPAVLLKWSAVDVVLDQTRFWFPVS